MNRVSKRFSFTGMYSSRAELESELDAVYGVGNWKLEGSVLETRYPDGRWGAYYRVAQYGTGRYEIYDET